jgi:predicted RNase H-like HicB family nuclease
MFYPVEFENDEGGVIATALDLPGTNDCGSTREEALIRLQGAALAIIQSLIDDNEPIPAPSSPNGRAVIALPRSGMELLVANTKNPPWCAVPMRGVTGRVISVSVRWSYFYQGILLPLRKTS